MVLPGYNRNRKFVDPDPDISKSFIRSLIRQYNLKWVCISCNITTFTFGIQVIYFIICGTSILQSPSIVEFNLFLNALFPQWILYILVYVYSILISPIYQWEFETLFGYFK
jgi:hypothetical protein